MAPGSTATTTTWVYLVLLALCLRTEAAYRTTANASENPAPGKAVKPTPEDRYRYVFCEQLWCIIDGVKMVYSGL